MSEITKLTIGGTSYDVKDAKALRSDGTANAAKKLSEARNVILTGDVTGSATFDGSSDLEIETTGQTWELKGDYTEEGNLTLSVAVKEA